MSNIFITKFNITKSDTKILCDLKDIIVYQRTTAGSYLLKDFQAPYEADIITLLRNNYTIIGKSNLDEFGCGSYTNTSFIGPCIVNDQTPGGSSGGTAAAIFTRKAHIGMGSDTGGSCRLPALILGLTGFKPSLGMISRVGLIAYSDTLDVIGLISYDIKLIYQTFNIICGKGSDLLLGCSVYKCHSAGTLSLSMLINSAKLVAMLYKSIAYCELSSNLSRYYKRDWNKVRDVTYETKEYKTLLRLRLGKECYKRFLLGKKLLVSTNIYLRAMGIVDKLRTLTLTRRPIIHDMTNWTVPACEHIMSIANIANLPAALLTIDGKKIHIMGPRGKDKALLRYIQYKWHLKLD